MRRWAFLLLFTACSNEAPCLDLVEQACLMAKEKTKGPKTTPEEAEAVTKACDEAKVRAEKADDAMNAECAESPSTYRKSIQLPKTTAPTQPK